MRRANPSRSGVLAGFILLAACGEGDPGPLPPPPEGFPFAFAMTDCAPWDGLATSIFLSAGEIQPEGGAGPVVPTPYLVITVYEGSSEIAGREFEIDQNRVAGASFCESDGGCLPAAGGRVRIGETSGEGSLVGEFELEFDGRPDLAGGFEAKWVERLVLCG